jgi:hypothetical protein
VTSVGREGTPPRWALVGSHDRVLIRTVESFRRLAASANATDLAVDVRIFLIKDILRDGRRCGDIGGTRLAVAYRR